MTGREGRNWGSIETLDILARIRGQTLTWHSILTSARTVSARPRPGQHPLTTDKEACAPNLQRPYFSSSVIRSNKLCFSSAIPAVK